MQSQIDSESESEKEVADSTIMYRKAFYKSEVPELEIPFAVQDIISRIEQAQLHRAREDINIQLNDILLNVQRIINRYTLDENVHSGKKISLIEHKKRRIYFLEKIVTYAKNAEIREKILVYILAWLEEWNLILSEITAMDIEEHHHWIAQMEFLPETFKAIESNVKILSRISVSLFEERKRQKKRTTSRGTLWKSWKERVIKRPATAHALRPDQMISDEFATNTKVSEIQDMLQELINTTMFNKLENNAIKYISSTIVNLSKALSTLTDELKVFNLQSASMYINETNEKEKELSLKIMRELSENNEMLQQKLRDAEEKYEYLIRSKGVVQPRGGTALPTSPLNVLPELSSQSSIAISKADREDSTDDILVKEFENILDEAQTKGTKGLGIKWNSTISYTAPVEITPDLTEEQYPLPEKKQKEASEDKISLKKGDIHQKDGTDQHQSQKKKQTKGPYTHETSGSNLSDDKSKKKASETKFDHHLELQALEKKRKEIKSFSEAKSKPSTESKSQHVLADYPTDTKSQHGKGGTSSLWEQLRKVKPEYSQDRSQISSENKEEPTTESGDKEGMSEMSSQEEQFRLTQLGYSPQKVKTKGKKHQDPPATITSKQGKLEEDMLVFTKKVKSHRLVKSQSRVTEETSESTRVLGSADGKSEESNLEEFQDAIIAFLKEKIDNIGKPLDKKIVPKEELLLKGAEVEKLGIIKAKIEEYFQNVAETVTKTLRKYKDIKNVEQVGEKRMKQKKEVSFMPGLYFQKPISAKPEISTLFSSKSMDPLTDNLIQTILTEIEGERDAPVASTVGRDHREKEKQRQEEYMQEGQEKILGKRLKHQLKEEESFWKKSYEVINKKPQEEESWLQMKVGKQGQQKHKQWQEEEIWKEQQKQRMQKRTEQEEEQMQRKEEEEYQQPKQQKLEAWNEKMEKPVVPLEKEKGQQKEVRYQELEINWKKEKQKPRRNAQDHEGQWQKKPKDQMKINEKNSEEREKMFSQTSMTLFPKWKSIPRVTSQSHQRKEFLGRFKTLHIPADGKHPIPTTPLSTQLPSPEAFPISGHSPTGFPTLTPQQAQAPGITVTSQKAEEALGITVAPEQAQAPGITLTPEQAQALGITLTPQQAQERGITLTPQQAQELGITLTPQQAQERGITLTPQQAQTLGITLTRQQISRSPLSQAPGKLLGMRIPPDPGKLLAPQTFPSSKQSLVSEGQSTSVQSVPPKVPLPPGKLPTGEDLPTSGQPLTLETLLSPRKFFTSWSPQLPMISESPFALREPLLSGTPLSSAQMPSLLAPLSPRKPFVPGPSSTLEEFLEPRPLTHFEEPQAFQPPATCEQSPYLRVPSTLEQHQASPLWIPPIPGHPPALWTSLNRGKPQKDMSSSVSKETFQSYLTNYRTAVSQIPYIGGRALPSLMKPLTTKLPKTSQISSKWDQKTQFPPIDKSWILTSDSVTKKHKMMVPPSSSQEFKEQRYFVDVEAQRKNLTLLNQATKSFGLPSQLHTTAANLIIETLHTDRVRLGYLFRKYIAYRLIQRARNNIIRRLQAVQNTGKGYETQNLYIMLSRIDDYQKKVMQVWTDKQKSLEQKRNQCLRNTMSLFSQLQMMYKLNLRQPIPLIIDKKQIPASTEFVQQPFLELLIEEDRKSDTFKKFRQDQMGAIWNTDLSTSSYPITEKTSIHLLWAQLGGYPDIPMLLQLDVQSTFRKSLASIKSRFKKIPK
ncbi:protein FAM186A isoform X9 [Canis lupus dingo]|uniref:protein FAM186A isoform X9 n=1 Tax=Canis lupus dingo TaxID=286419 RepID=UPI0020C28D7C|nr:protein FAM186A isoform X9 [Canis lupus dingo]